MDWYEKAAQEIEDDLTVGDITPEQYRAAMYDLNREYREQQLNDIRGDGRGSNDKY